MSPSTLLIGALASGRGSNVERILEQIQTGNLRASVAVVISNRESAPALGKAKEHGVPAQFIDPKSYASLADYDAAILDVLQNHHVELVVLAGYMKIVSSLLINAYPNRIMNIHPSLLPSFPGLYAQRQALESGVKVTGCTVHFVEEAVDAGPIILQSAVPVKEDDTEETLAERILEQEHKLYPNALQLYSEGRLKVEGSRVRITKT